MTGWIDKFLDPFPRAQAAPPPQGLLPFMWDATQGARGLLAVVALLSAGTAAFDAFLFAMLGSVIDWLAAAPPEKWWQTQGDKLMSLGLVLLASPVLVALKSLFRDRAVAINFSMRLRWNFHRHMLKQSLSFYHEEFAGRVSSVVMQTALAVRDTWMRVIDSMVFLAIYFTTAVGLMAGLAPLLLVPFVCWLACYAVAVWFFLPRLGALAEDMADARNLMTGRITDAYANIGTVKLFSHARSEADFAKAAMQDLLVQGSRQVWLFNGVTIVDNALSMALIAGTTCTALWLWTENTIATGAVAAAITMALRLGGLAQGLIWQFSGLVENLGTVRDGMNTLAKPIAIEDAPGAPALQVTGGGIRFESVSFSYTGQRTVLDDVTLDIRPGEKVGLVGRSGSGKSTLLNLLLRLYDVESGRVLVDGQDISKVTQESLRAHVGMVMQDTSLLHRSVRENLMYGRPSATEGQMRLAALRAEASEFIALLADSKGRTGFDAHIGERGAKLSGGQRQRLSIARVMLKDAPILLLDEATSALDSEVEASIQRSLYRLMEGKTVIAIAHRLSTIATMDRLIVMDRGRIVEQGTHESLLAKGGIYAKLWAHQSGGFLIEDDDVSEPETLA